MTAIVVVLTVLVFTGFPLAIRHSECAQQDRAVAILKQSSRGTYTFGAGYAEGGKVLETAIWLGDHADRLTRSEFCGRVVNQFRPVSSLDFRDAQLTPEDWQAVLACREITFLNLARTNVSDAQISELARLPALEMLVIIDTGIGPGCRSLAPLSQLRYFATSGTKISDDDLLAIGGFPKLEFLGLTRTPLTDKCAPFIGHCPRLVSISVDHSSVGDQFAAELPKCPKLKILGLSNTQVTDAAVAKILASGPLASLSVQFSHITDDGLARLASIRTLRLLTVDASQITPKSIAALKEHGTLRTLRVDGKNPAELKPKIALLKTELAKTLVDDISTLP